jgi:hypothetical protein
VVGRSAVGELEAHDRHESRPGVSPLVKSLLGGETIGRVAIIQSLSRPMVGEGRPRF